MHRGLQGRGLAVPQHEPAPELTQRSTAALIRAVQLNDGGAFQTVDDGQFQWAVSGRTHHRQGIDGEAAPRQCPDGAVQWHLEGRCPDNEDDQGADEPAHRKPEKTARRHDGADDEMDRHERQ